MTDYDPATPRLPLRRVAVLTAFLVAAWLLWSGLFKPLLLGLGVVSCVLTLYLLLRMGYFGNETYAFRYTPRLIGYWVWLSKEIVISSIQVARRVLAPKIDVTPGVAKLDVSDLGPVDQVLLGNSITLTPGTLTLDVWEGRLLVHGLMKENADALVDGEMPRRIRALRDR